MTADILTELGFECCLHVDFGQSPRIPAWGAPVVCAPPRRTSALLTRWQRVIADGHCDDDDVAAAVTESATGRTAEQ
jgi:hypothetical protein